MAAPDCDAFVFLEDSGNEGMNLSAQQVSRFHVVAGIVVEPQHLESFQTAIAGIVQEHFRNSEMKAARCNDDKKLLISTKMVNIDVPYSVSVSIADKSQLRSKGLSFAASFTKVMMNRMLSLVFRQYARPGVISDNIKGDAFTREVKDYLLRQRPRSLLRQWELEFQDSRSNLMLQAADMVAGCIWKAYENRPGSPKQHGLFKIWKSKISSGLIIHYPEKYEPVTAEDIPLSEYRLDESLEQLAVTLASNYLNSIGESSREKAQFELQCITALLEHHYMQRQNSWLPSHSLARRCQTVSDDRFDSRKLRAIIGRLRDKGILIASRRNRGGYKLPTCRADLIEFINTQNEKLGPMLSRINVARKAVHRQIGYDMVSLPQFHRLKALLEPLSQT